MESVEALASRLNPRQTVVLLGRRCNHDAGSLSAVSFTDAAIAAYLTDGTVPALTTGVGYDLGCPPVPAPGDQASGVEERPAEGPSAQADAVNRH